MKKQIRYLNTDLDLTAPFDLKPLAKAFAKSKVVALDVSEHSDGTWTAVFEANAEFSSAEPTIVALLEAIESFDSKARQIWSSCALRELNIGYDCGDEPRYFSNQLSVSTLFRMASLNIGLVVTLYPSHLQDTQSQKAASKPKTKAKLQ